MEFIIGIGLVILTLLVPYLVYGFVYGIVLTKRLITREWKGKKQGLKEAVAEWQDMNSEERMEASTLQQEAASRWLESPSPEEEEEIMNEKVYTEGIKHHLPETEIELVPKEPVKNIRP